MIKVTVVIQFVIITLPYQILVITIMEISN